MEIKVINNVPNIKVTVNQSEDGSFAILLAEDNKVTLGSVKSGSVVKLGNRKYIVLGHGTDTTAVITKDFAKSMKFGKDGNYATSYVREYCNGNFYCELCKAVGAENIVKHTVNLLAVDGSNKGIVVQDNVSILTNDLYRRYRKSIPAYGDRWWTATRVTTLEKSYARGICSVNFAGILDWTVCDYSNGVRPFCILNSSILVS